MENTKQLVLVNQLVTTPITKEVVTSADFTQKYEYLVALTKYLEDVKKNVDDVIKDLAKMQYYETGENSIINGGFKYTYVPETTRETFNTKEFKAANPEIYKQYIKISNVSDSLKTFRLKPDEGVEE